MQKHGAIEMNEKGSTLIEVLIAVMVFAIGILAVGQMQITAINGNSLAGDLTEAVTLGQNKIEMLLNLPYTDSTVDSQLVDTDGDGTNQDTNSDGIDDQGPDFNFGLNDNTTATADHNEIHGRYTVLWNVAEDHPTSDTKTIRVIVTWKKRTQTKQVSLTTIKAKTYATP